MRRTGRSGFVSLFLGLGLLGVAGGAAAAWLAPLHHLFDLIAMFAAPALTSAVIGLVLAGLARRWRLAGGFVVAGLALLLALRPQWFPSHPEPAPGAAPVRVYFANVWAQNHEVEAIARSVAAADADVVAMVEITDEHAAALPRILKDYPYRSSSQPARFFAGGPRAVIASKWPLRKTPVLQDGLAAEDVMVAAPSGEFRFIALHLTRPWPLDGRKGEQIDQTVRLALRIRHSERAPVLAMGDFNATASSDVLRDFAGKAGVTPAPARVGTWPDFLPSPFRIAIDNAFAGHGLTVTRREIGAANGSDHRPIIVEIAPAAGAATP